MDHILRPIRAEGSSFSFLDDVIVTSEETNPHLADIRKVFDILRAAKLKLNSKKCQFFKEEVVFLGHIVGPDGIKPDP